MDRGLNPETAGYIADAHCDTLLNIAEGRGSLLVNDYNTSRRAPFIQLFAIWTENGTGTVPEAAAERYGLSDGDIFGYVKRVSEDYFKAAAESGISHCDSFSDVRKAVSLRRNISMPALEGSGFIDSPEKLRFVREELRIRFLMLTWNHSNALASGALDSLTSRDLGLTDRGRALLKECAKLDIAVDLSHASFKTMRDVLKYYDGPVFASHSNFYAVTKHPRNLPADVAKEIARRGGFIGLSTYLPFVREGVSGFSDYRASFIMDHVGYALSEGLGGSVGFGFDIDGVEGYPCDISLSESIHDQYVDMLGGGGNIDGVTLDRIKCGNFISFLKRI